MCNKSSPVESLSLSLCGSISHGNEASDTLIRGPGAGRPAAATLMSSSVRPSDTHHHHHKQRHRSFRAFLSSGSHSSKHVKQPSYYDIVSDKLEGILAGSNFVITHESDGKNESHWIEWIEIFSFHSIWKKGGPPAKRSKFFDAKTSFSSSSSSSSLLSSRCFFGGKRQFRVKA